jgi:hypothetical protein
MLRYLPITIALFLNATAFAQMPGLEKEVSVLYVEPNQRVEFAIDFNQTTEHLGFAVFRHSSGEELAFHCNQPWEGHGTPGFAWHGGATRPCKLNGKGGGYAYENRTDEPAVLLLCSFQHHSGNAKRLKLLASPSSNTVLYGGGTDTKYNGVYVRAWFSSLNEVKPKPEQSDTPVAATAK